MSPTCTEIELAIEALQARRPGYLSVRNAGNSVQGRPVYAITITDPSTPGAADDDKQHVLVLASQHGEEESSRLIALELLEWLTSDQAREIRRQQKIVVMPNVNPDGTETDTRFNAQGINLNTDHAMAGAVSPEAQAVERIARELAPEAVVDLHSRGHAGCSYDMVLFPATRSYTEDGRLAAATAEEMAAAGEWAGIPHLVHPLTWPGWWDGQTSGAGAHTLEFMYREFKSLCVLTETSESNEVAPPAALRAAAGLARLRAFLSWGQRHHPGLCYPGYPVNLVTNMFCLGIAAVGGSAAQRRRSRVGIWRNADGFRKLTLERPEQPDRKIIRCVYDGPELNDGVGMQVRVAGRRTPSAVHLNGRLLGRPDPERLTTWQDSCSTYVLLSLPTFAPGSYELKLHLPED
jgi:predicted deacylase